MIKNEFIKNISCFRNSSDEIMKELLVIARQRGIFPSDMTKDGMQKMADESDGNMKKPIWYSSIDTYTIVLRETKAPYLRQCLVLFLSCTLYKHQNSLTEYP